MVLPPGALRMENVTRNGQPLLRVSVDQTVIEGRNLFLGDGRGAMHFEAVNEGIHWVPPKGGKGFVLNGVWTNEPGSTVGDADLLTVDKLKAGSVYLMTPSIKFEFGPGANPAR